MIGWKNVEFKGVTTGEFIKYDAIPDISTGQRMHDALVARPGCLCDQCQRARALLRLWAPVLDNMEFLHPDPGVTVSTSIFQTESLVRVMWSMKNVRDTSDFLRVRRQPSDFNMQLVIKDWPGKEAAEMTLLGAWLIYVRHEAMELVRQRVPERLDSSGRVPWHPHGSARPGKDIRNAVYA